MSTDVRYTPTFKAGVAIEKQALIPRLAADPVAPTEAEVWYNTTDDVYRGYANGVVVSFGAGLSTEAVQDIVGAFFADSTHLDVTYDDAGNAISAVVKADSITNAELADMAQATFKMRAAGAGTGNPIDGTPAQAKTALAIVAADISDFVANARTSISVTDTATLDLSYAGGAISGAVLDSPKLEGNTLAQVQTAIVAAIVDGAPGTLDTLNEIAAALGDNPDVITDILTALSGRARVYAEDLTGGATTEDIEHGFTLTEQGDFVAKVFVKATGVEEVYKITGTDADTVQVIDETGGNIPAGRRIVILAGAS